MSEIIPILDDRDYYCSMKFRFQKIDLESKTTYTCHAAVPHKVDFSWLEENPGELHNTALNVAERAMMLQNVRNASCEQNCWAAEDVGAQSPRQYQGGQARTHEALTLRPEIIDITIGSDCNLTCTYCCKEFSSAWRRDIVNNGNYDITGTSDDRFVATPKDKILIQTSQPGRKEMDQYQKLLAEVALVAPTARKIVITGGEPFLDNALIGTLANLVLADDAVIELYSGFGVSVSRFKKIAEKLQSVNQLYINVSAEATGKFFEFNRYGNEWADFVTKLEILDQHGVEYMFHAVISNLTIFGFADFYRMFGHKKIEVTFAYQPTMMAPYVLDNTSKQRIMEDIQLFPDSVKGPIMESIKAEPSQLQRQNLKEFLTEFVNRRPDLSLDIFPSTFLEWVA
jgi:organic radical activating enzyme